MSARNSKQGATIHREDASQIQPGRKQSIRLTVKASPSKLRQALHQDDGIDVSDSEPPVRNARSTRNPKNVVEPDSDDDELSELEDDEEEDDENDDEEEEDDEDTEGEDDNGDIDADLLAAEDSEDNKQGRSTDRGRISASDMKAASKIVSKNSAKSKAPIKSVEEREEEQEGSLSDLGSDEDAQEIDDVEQDDLGDEMDIDSEDESHSMTPDPNKMTRRQRAAQEEELDGSLLALSNEAQVRKHITAEEHATRRLEMARRRKNLSDKKNEEEKMDTINKLLSKPAAKRKTRAEIMAEAAKAGTGEGGEGSESSGPDPLFVRWVNNAQGSRIGVPRAWLEGPVGQVLAQGWEPPPEVKLIEEVA